MKKEIKILEEVSTKLLSLMTSTAKVTVEYDKEGDVFVVNIEAGEETGLLIGKKGDTLLSIQTIIGVLFKQKMGEWKKVVVNVGDYREKEEDYLKTLATTTAERAVETGNPQNLYNLKAWQRRVVHLSLAENKNISTESEGEGEDRYLVIKPIK